MTFSTAVSAPTWKNLQVLLWGAILCPRQRTVTAALRALGQEQTLGTRFGKYHRVLNRARWSPLVMSRLLLDLIVKVLVPAQAPLVLLIDETLDRRRGPRIRYLGWFRDAVRSTGRRVTFALGIRWCCVCVLTPVRWSRRPWALPFLTVPVLSVKCCAKWKKRHRGPVDWAAWVLRKVRRWQPGREIMLVGDGSYSALSLIAQAQQLSSEGAAVRVVTGLRLDAGLYDFAPKSQRGRSGPKRKKGDPQTKLSERLMDPESKWRKAEVGWYGGETKQLQMMNGICLWYKRGSLPVPVHWVLVRSLDDPHFKPAAYLCSDVNVTPQQILEWVIGRWNIEVTFEEMRAHLGFETQRHWSQRAIERTTPCLFGIFSLIVLMAHLLHPRKPLPRAQSSWYAKQEATFSDVIAAVRGHLWRADSWGMSTKTRSLSLQLGNSSTSGQFSDWCLIPRHMFRSMQRLICYAS